MSSKIALILYLLHHNLITIYTTTKSSVILQNLMGIFCNLQKWNTTLTTKDIRKTTCTTPCNLYSHGWYGHIAIALIDHLHTSKNILIKLLIVVISQLDAVVMSQLDAVVASLNVLQPMGFSLNYVFKLTL